MQNKTSTSTLLASFFLIPLFLLVGCGGNFNWDKDVANITGKNLEKWLRKAPFTNELSQKDKITNITSLFPFLGQYYQGQGRIVPLHSSHLDTVVYKQETVIYQDPAWGELFLHAMLLHKKDEVFLNNFYSESGNPFFEENAMEIFHVANLYETKVASKNDRYKTAIYWAGTGNKSYLLGFYQQGQLVMEATIPLIDSDTTRVLNKLKEVNKELNLNIPEWEQANPADLRESGTVGTFWKTDLPPY